VPKKKVEDWGGYLFGERLTERPWGGGLGGLSNQLLPMWRIKNGARKGKNKGDGQRLQLDWRIHLEVDKRVVGGNRGWGGKGDSVRCGVENTVPFIPKIMRRTSNRVRFIPGNGKSGGWGGSVGKTEYSSVEEGEVQN